MSEKKPLVLTVRELSEVRLAMNYAADYHHGTVGHNSYMLLAKFAEDKGFEIQGKGIIYPDNVEVIPQPA